MELEHEPSALPDAVPPAKPDDSPSMTQGYQVPVLLFLALLVACIGFATVMTWYTLYQQTRMNAIITAFEARQDRLEAALADLAKEVTRHQSFVQRIPTMDATVTSQQASVLENTLTLKALDARSAGNSQRIGELQRDIDGLRLRLNDLAYIKRVHPPTKKERPSGEP
jgi:type II secretory pathway component PulJ